MWATSEGLPQRGPRRCRVSEAADRFQVPEAVWTVTQEGRQALLRAGRKSLSGPGRPGPTAPPRGYLGAGSGWEGAVPRAWPSRTAGDFYRPRPGTHHWGCCHPAFGSKAPLTQA